VTKEILLLRSVFLKFTKGSNVVVNIKSYWFWIKSSQSAYVLWRFGRK